VPGDDGRSQPFRLTRQGRKLLEKAVPAWSEAQQQVKRVLGESFVEQLNEVINKGAMKRGSKATAAH
jgi:DNA-binding MarR family transcriptional regulator